jgi:hypothetical protein
MTIISRIVSCQHYALTTLYRNHHLLCFVRVASSFYLKHALGDEVHVNASLSHRGGAARSPFTTYLEVSRGKDCRWVLRACLATVAGGTQYKLRSTRLPLCMCACVRACARARAILSTVKQRLETTCKCDNGL